MLEYKGYLMVGYYNYLVVIIYICVDEYLDIIYGGWKNEDGYLFY